MNGVNKKRGEEKSSPYFYFLGWQEPPIGQSAHPHPQADFPFFLFLTILTIIAAITAIKAAQMIIAAILSFSQASILLPPFTAFYLTP